MAYLQTLMLLRPHQYVKNLFIFLPLFFGLKITDQTLLYHTLIAFIAFSLTASATYIFNDYLDIEDDKKHPEKKNRALASGAISKSAALMLMCILVLISFTLMSQISLITTGILLFYFVLNIAYSIKLKHIAIVDIIIIANGFVLRLFVGSTVSEIHLSMWIVIMTFLLALFIALAKRRDDIIIYNETGKKMRKVVNGYNMRFIETSMSIMASVTIVAYITYTASDRETQQFNNEYLYLTSLFVIMGILRYIQITFVKEESGSPTKIILTDPFIQLALVGWIFSFVWILY